MNIGIHQSYITDLRATVVYLSPSSYCNARHVTVNPRHMVHGDETMWLRGPQAMRCTRVLGSQAQANPTRWANSVGSAKMSSLIVNFRVSRIRTLGQL